jgi:alkylhydroperoxidase family enzyme
MDRTNAIFVSNPEAEPLSADDVAVSRAGEQYFEVYVAMQKRATHRRLDDQLADLVTDRATEFAALTPREQAAIAWVEAVISSGKTQSSDGAYAALRKHFDEAAIAKLTALAGTASARAKLGASRRG